MSNLLKTESLGELTVEEIMDLNVDQIEESGFAMAPVGLYSAMLVGFNIPNPAEDKEFFEAQVRLTGVIEVAEEDEEDAASAIGEDGLQLNDRYYQKGGWGVAQMRTVWGDVILENAGGSLGQFFANCAEEGFELPINLQLKHRVSKPSKNATDAQKAAFEPKTYMEIEKVVVG